MKLERQSRHRVRDAIAARAVSTRSILRWAAPYVLIAACAGCGNKNKGAAVVESVPRDFVFRPRPSANGGRPVYVLVRSVSESDFLTDAYRKISAFVYPNSGDPSVLGVMLIWPNREHKVKLEVPTAKAVGVYGMFSKPGDQWKLLLAQPLKPKNFFQLEKNTLSVEREASAKKKTKKK